MYELTRIQHPGAINEVAHFHLINLRQLPNLHFEIVSSGGKLLGATLTISPSSAVNTQPNHTSMD
jgi:hypothetical protein